MTILDLIGCGKLNATSRKSLMLMSGWSDRRIREEIEVLRHQGYIICNDQDGAGYYLTTNLDDIERQYKQNLHRFKAIAHQQKFLRKRLKAAGRM